MSLLEQQYLLELSPRIIAAILLQYYLSAHTNNKKAALFPLLRCFLITSDYWCVTALHIAHLRYPCLCSVSECYNIIMCPMWQERKCAKHIDQWSENAVPTYFHVTETKQDWDKFSSFSVISTTLHKHLCLRHDFVQTSLTLITDCEVKQQPQRSDKTCYLTMFV